MCRRATVTWTNHLMAARPALIAAMVAMALTGCPAGDELPRHEGTSDGRRASAAEGASATSSSTKPPTRSLPDALRNWGHWRGPLMTGFAPEADPPIEWSETRNIRWKTDLAGLGHSTPVVWDDRIYVTTAVPYGEALPPRPSTAPGTHDNLPVTHRQEFMVMALDRRDGRILWQRTVRQALPEEAGHYTASLASNSPTTDGQRIFAFFGSFGLYCLDPGGEVLWEVDFGPMQSLHGHGEGSSPLLHGGTLFVNWDHEGQSFLVALDPRTGAERWRVERDEPTSWASPIVYEHGGRMQLIVSGTNRIRAYDPADGSVIWECGGLSDNVVASPVAGNGMVYAGSSYTTRAILAIRLQGAAGDITTSDHVVWKRVRGSPYVPSPLLYGDALYYLNHYQNVLTRVHGPTGEDRPGAIRLEGIRNIYASPVAAAGRIYITDLDGGTLVLTDGDRPEVLALNVLDDSFSASAALVGRELFLRGERSIYCIREE